MNFINNWSRPIELAAGALSCPLDLPDGEYRLTLADAPHGATRWEIIGANVAAGEAALERGLEGTDDQEWPTGSVIYCSLTAGLVSELFARIKALEGPVPTHRLTASASPYTSAVGYESPVYGDYGALEPATIEIDGSLLTILVLTAEPAMSGMNITIELSASVVAALRLRIAGAMPAGVEWIEMSINGDYRTIYVESMPALEDGEDYDIWIEVLE